MARTHPKSWQAVAFLSLLALPTTVAEPEATALFDYALGSTASGDLRGRCDSSAVLFPLVADGGVQVAFASAVFELFETRWNTTTVLVGPEYSTITGEPSQRRVASQPLAPGEAAVSWTSDGRARLFEAAWPGDGAHFDVAFAVTELRSSPLLSSVDAGDFLVQSGEAVTTLTGGVPGWQRVFDARNGTLAVTGDVTFYVEDASVRQGSDEWTTGPPRSVNDVAGTPAARHREHVHRHGLLHLDAAQIILSAEEARFACSGLISKVSGTLLAHGASGNIQAGERTTSFGPADLSLVGSFTVDERVAASDGEASTVQGQVRGRFNAVGFDFAPADVGLKISPLAAAAGGALVAAMVGALAWHLYTRLEKPAVLSLPSRSLIYDALRNNPWISLADLGHVTGLRRSTLRYQLGVLQRHGFIRRARTGGSVRFAVSGDPAAEAAPKDPIVQSLQRQLQDGPLRLADVMRVLVSEHQYSRFGAWKAVRRARADGFVQVDRDAKGVWVRCAP